MKQAATVRYQGLIVQKGRGCCLGSVCCFQFRLNIMTKDVRCQGLIQQGRGCCLGSVCCVQFQLNIMTKEQTDPAQGTHKTSTTGSMWRFGMPILMMGRPIQIHALQIIVVGFKRGLRRCLCISLCWLGWDSNLFRQEGKGLCRWPSTSHRRFGDGRLRRIFGDW